MPVKNPNIQRNSGIPRPLAKGAPIPVVRPRAPRVSDRDMEIGQLWVDTSADTSYILCNITNGEAIWVTTPSGGINAASMTINPGDLTVTVGDVIVSAGDLDVSAGTATLFALNAGATTIDDLTVNNNAAFNGNVDITGDFTVTGDFDITDTESVSITSTKNAPGAITLLVNGGTAETMLLQSSQGTGVDAITIRADAGGVEITGSRSDEDAIRFIANDGGGGGGMHFDAQSDGFLFESTGGEFIVSTGTGAISLSPDSQATTINIGTGNAIKTIDIGGAGANNIGIGSNQVGGSIVMGFSMVAGTIDIGGSNQTGSISIAPSTQAQDIFIANDDGKKTILMGGGVDGNDIQIGNGINTSAQTIGIASGDSAADNIVLILAGDATAGFQGIDLAGGNYATGKEVLIGNGTGANNIFINPAINTSAQTVTIQDGASAANATVSILSGNKTAGTSTLNLAQGTGGKTVNMASGAGANIVTIGSTTGASSLTMQCGTGGAVIDSLGLLQITTDADVQASPTTASTMNVRVGKAIFTGFTTAVGASQNFTINSTDILTTSAVMVTVSSLDVSGNGALLTLQGVIKFAGALGIVVKNDGLGALGAGDNVTVTFWVLDN